MATESRSKLLNLPRINAFEMLCRQASRESWCWKLFCGTCGHYCFRYGFKELIEGKHPYSKSWVTRRGIHPSSLPARLGPVPSAGNWPIDEQEILSNILSGARISEIASSCHYPSWLGYLGLGLYYTAEVEKKTRGLTRSWIPSICEMISHNESAKTHFDFIFLDQHKVLQWQDLGICEKAISRR